MRRYKIRLWRALRRAERSWKREIKWRRGPKSRKHNGANGRHVGRSLPILDFLRHNYAGKGKIPVVKDKVVVTLPKIFSFLRDPVNASRVIHEIIDASTTTAPVIFLDYQQCEDTDLCASLALGIVARELSREWRAQQTRRRFAGTYSKIPHVCEVMRCTGIIKHLRISREAPSLDVAKKFEIFDFMHGFTTTLYRRSSLQEKCSQKLAEYFVKCFERLGLELSGEAQTDLVELIGEVMDNAERHSMRNEWWAQAYFDQSESESSHGVCHLAIISLGRTVADSLRTAPNASATHARIAELVNNHKRSPLFGLRSPLTEENLLTFYALQDGVSCTTEAGAGSGTVKLIEHFQGLSRPDENLENSRMTVLSGSTQIVFDHKFRLQSIQGRKVIAFNESNSLDEPPSPNNVRHLPVSFPGTIIALRFHMERGYLQQLPSLFNETTGTKSVR